MASTPYDEAHLIVSAIRVLNHRNAAPPSVEEVSDLLKVSLEQGNRLCRRVCDAGVAEVVDGAYGPKLFVKNHLAIEELPREAPKDALEGELKKFQDERRQIRHKVEAIQAKQAEKQKALFAELEKKLKGKKETDES